MNLHNAFGVTSRDPIDILLINMPFGPLDKPSIGLGLLQAITKQAGLNCTTLNFTLLFAQQISNNIYDKIAISHYAVTEQIGEWAFSVGLYPPATSGAYIEDVLLATARAFGTPQDKEHLDDLSKYLLDIRGQVEDFLDKCLSIVLSYQPKLVGFTSTFQQQMAALGLAKRIKEHQPDTTVIFGGANVESTMGVELVQQFKFVDAVVSGEADLIFSDIAKRVVTGESINNIQGVYTQYNIDFVDLNGAVINAPSVQDMDILPFPDYSDFIAQYEELQMDFSPYILFETSRGCWWGAKSHCSFCGLNGLTMRFRSKSPTRALEEILQLCTMYPSSQMAAVDNILDMKYSSSFVPDLASQNLDLALFYEVKANLKKEHLRLLRQAKINMIQPGIESFSTPVLNLMKKGIKGIQNVQLLKWCQEFGIHPSWNVIWGFPGEQPSDYHAMAAILPLLTHLSPPMAWGMLRLDRFSPLFTETSGVCNVRPYPCYEHLYPYVPKEKLANLAYYFTFDYEDNRSVYSYTREVVQELNAWKETHHRSQLYLLHRGDEVFIWDLRPIAPASIVRLSGLTQALYLACDTIQGADTLIKIAQPFIGLVSRDDIHKTMQAFVDAKLMIEEDGTYLSLAVWLSDNSLLVAQYQQALGVLEIAGQLPDYFYAILPASERHSQRIQKERR